MRNAPFYISRRRFLASSSLLAAAASGVPRWFIEQSLAQQGDALPKSANARPNIALIGCGGRGRHITRQASKFGNVVAVCDVDARHLAEAKKEWPHAQAYRDYQEALAHDGVEVVTIGTPDHWHTIPALAAMKAGMDVYCEKPLTLTIDEGKKLVNAAAKHQRIFQTGSQQRSSHAFRLACELVRNGRIGELKRITAGIPAGRHGGPFPTRPVPQPLDWNFWLGQAPKVDYVPERCHGSFRYWLDYSGGTMTDWGAHHNDIALWGMGLERGGPAYIEGRALTRPVPGGYDAPSRFHVTYKYTNGVTHICTSEAPRGVKFEGTEGWIFVKRYKVSASDPKLIQDPLPPNAEKLYVSNDHMANFFEGVHKRKTPICDAEIGHRSVSVCHLGVLAIRTGKALEWDPVREQFTGDSQPMNSYLTRDMREGYGYDVL